VRIALASGGFAPMVTPNGQTLVFHRNNDKEPKSIWQAPVRGGAAPRRVFNDASPNYMPDVSPDGKWLAYVSSQEGHEEVFVRAFPGPGSPMQVSTSGGSEPGWSPDGSRIFYRDKRSLMSARVMTKPAFNIAPPERLFEGAFDAMPHRNYDVSLDGTHFLMIATTLPDAVIVLNWLPELRFCLRAAAKGERCRVPVPPG
jgi:dipeptidyl aminopeptidase/acylaminoacyl peptidase